MTPTELRQRLRELGGPLAWCCVGSGLVCVGAGIPLRWAPAVDAGLVLLASGATLLGLGRNGDTGRRTDRQ